VQHREKLVLKEDVAGLYGCSWELFVHGSAARKNHMLVLSYFLQFTSTFKYSSITTNAAA